MKKPTDMGMNRTGISLAPVKGPAMLAGMDEFSPNPTLDKSPMEEECAHYLEQGEVVGSMPPPPSLKGAARTILGMASGVKVNVLLDKIGERLAFERSGTRLYEGLILKCETQAHGFKPPLDELQRHHDQELEHFHLLEQVLIELGADPTAVTPCADVAGVASVGLFQVMGDPRTTVLQGLDALLVAELADEAGWELLVELARAAGHDDLADRFTQPLKQEVEHLENVRDWIKTGLEIEAGIASEQPTEIEDRRRVRP